jgi:hypothetical protein
MMDRATKYSLDYVSLLEERLHFGRDSRGDVFWVDGSINEMTLEILRGPMRELLREDTYSAAISDSESYGANSDNLQVVGFGNIPRGDFDVFIRLGLMSGTRVILWDWAGRLLMENRSSEIAIDSFALIAGNIVYLKELIELGAIVVLPHPTQWLLEDCIENLRIAGTGTQPSDARFAAVCAMTAKKIMPTELYSIIDDVSAVSEALAFSPDRQSREFEGQLSALKNVGNLITDVQLDFLQDIPLADFYGVISENKFFGSRLRDILDRSHRKESELVRNHALAGFRSQILDAIDAQNTALRKSKYARIETAFSNARVAVDLLTGRTLPAFLSTSFGIGAQAARTLGDRFSSDVDPSVVQTFSNLASARRRPPVRKISPTEFPS